MPPSNLLNGTTGILSSDSTPNIIIRQSVIKQLEKQNKKAIAQEQDIAINHVKSSVKWKSKFTSRNFRENGKNRMKFMRENQKKTMRDNLDDNRKGELKNDYQRKIKKRDNLDTHDKELLKNFEKKERENWAITLMIRKENRWKKVTKLERKKERKKERNKW